MESRPNERDQVLLGVTGSGKTFTMAKLIEHAQRPTLILAPNKTLGRAALWGDEAVLPPTMPWSISSATTTTTSRRPTSPRTDTYVEKDSQINEAIDRMRHAATQSLLERNDVVIVASVSCIYGIGSVETYSRMVVRLEVGGKIERDTLARALAEQQYRRKRYRLPAWHVPAARRLRRHLSLALRGPRLAGRPVR